LSRLWESELNLALSRTNPLALVFLVLLAFLLVIFRADWLSMYQVWVSNETFSHGILIAPISAWLLWKQRQFIFSQHWRPSLLGLVLLGVGCFGWLLGRLSEVSVVSQLGIVVMLIALFPIVLGIKLSWLLAFPLLFLLFMIPTGEFIEQRLMIYTADAIVLALNWSGVAVYRENLHLTLPTGRWSVVEACSGLRYLIAALVLAAMFCHLYYRTWKKRIAFVLACLVLSIVANWVRAYTVVLVGHFSDMKYGTGDDHIYYGWVFFGVVMFAIFWLGMKYKDDGYEPWLTPNTPTSESNTVLFKHFAFAAIACLTMWSTTIALAHFGRTTPDLNFVQVLKERAAELRLSPVNQFKLPLNPSFEKPIASVKLQGVEGDAFFSAYYADQRELSEMVRGNNYFIATGDAQLKIMKTEIHELQLEMGSVKVSQQLVKLGNDQYAVAFSWYCITGYCTQSNYIAKALTSFSMLIGQGDHSVASIYLKPLGSSDDKEAIQQAMSKVKAILKITSDYSKRV
jgi:exosortase A